MLRSSQDAFSPLRDETVCEVNDQSGPLDKSMLSSLTILKVAGEWFAFFILYSKHCA